MGVVGYFIVFFSGKGLPQRDYNPKLKDDAENLIAYNENKSDEFWRVIYIIPVVINSIMLLGFIFGIKYDSIMFNVSKNNDEGALNMIE